MIVYSRSAIHGLGIIPKTFCIFSDESVELLGLLHADTKSVEEIGLILLLLPIKFSAVAIFIIFFAKEAFTPASFPRSRKRPTHSYI